MMRTTFSRFVRAAGRAVARPYVLAAALAAVVPGAACVTVPDEGKAPILANHVEDWRDEVVYQLLTDRFGNGDLNNDYQVRAGALARFQGGDWQGIVDHLDYLQELGVTTLWISPIVKNVETDADVDSYHGYWAQDLAKLNPHFGDLADLRRMVAAVHERGMKVVLDIVTNHMGQAFFYDINMNGKADTNIGGNGRTSPVLAINEFDPDFDPRGVQSFTSLGEAGRAPIVFIQDASINRVTPGPGVLGRIDAYHGMGRTLNYDDPLQLLLGDFPGGLKDVATERQDVRDVMVDAYAKWVEETDLDGFRIDTVKHVEHEFWKDFAPRVRRRLAARGKSNFLMFGEAFDGNDVLLGSFTQPGELDSVFYFSQHYQVFRDVLQFAGDPARQKGTDQIAKLWGERPKNYGNVAQEGGIGVPPTKALVGFIDNHDVARFLFFAAGDDATKKNALRLALVLLMTEEGIPCVYYGTEQDFGGGNDPANREVLWQTGYPTSGDTFRHLAKLARVRREQPALRRGDQSVVFATPRTGDEEDAGLLAYERTGGGGAGYALVVLNTNARHASTTVVAGKGMAVTAAPGSALVDVLGPEAESVTVEADGTLRVTVPPLSARIFVPR